MALLDVSEVLLDPDLTTNFNVVRKTVDTDNHGRQIVTEAVTTGVLGVICSASQNDLERLGDYQTGKRYISIVCQFRLQMTSEGKQADTVQWTGDDYVVLYLDPYPQYGIGFVQAIAGSLDHQDAPVP